MSRIELALRRAAERRDETIAVEPQPEAPPSSESALETYPAERHSPPAVPNAPVEPRKPPIVVAVPVEPRKPSAVAAVQVEAQKPPAGVIAPAAASSRVPAAPHSASGSLAKSLQDSSLDGKLVTSSAVSALATAQYDELAAALRTLKAARGVRTVMVSSALPHEGKTLTAVNLALTLSERCGDRVLLVDADLEAASIHKVLQMPNISGLGDALSSTSMSVPVTLISERLSALPAGRVPLDGVSALLSPPMRSLLLEAAGTYDWIVLDAPAATQVEEPQLLAWLGDGVVLVVDAGTPAKAVQAAIVEFGPERVLGVVLNRTRLR